MSDITMMPSGCMNEQQNDEVDNDKIKTRTRLRPNSYSKLGLILQLVTFCLMIDKVNNYPTGGNLILTKNDQFKKGN